MNEDSPLQEQSKLNPLRVVHEAYRIVLANPREMVRMLWLGVLVSVLVSLKVSALEREAIGGLGEGASGEEIRTAMVAVWNDAWLFAHLFVDVLVMCGVFVSLHRFVLIGARPPAPLGINIAGREGRYMGYMLGSWAALGLVALVAGVAFSFLASFLALIMAGGDQNQIMATAESLIPMGIAATILLVGVVYVRLGLALPAVALDAPGGLLHRFRVAWRCSQGYVLKLVTLIVIAAVPLMAADIGIGFAFSGAPGEVMAWPLEFAYVIASAVVGMLGYAVTTTAFSLAFRELYRPEREFGPESVMDDT